MANRVKTMAAREAVGGGVELDLEVVYHGEDGPEEAFGRFLFSRTDATALGHVLRTIDARGMEVRDIERMRLDQLALARALEILTPELHAEQMYALTLADLLDLVTNAEGSEESVKAWLAERRT